MKIYNLHYTDSKKISHIICKEADSQSLLLDEISKEGIPTNISINDLEEIGLTLVNFKVQKPSDAIQFLSVPHVKHGFINSCSECASESIFRYWKIKNWNQFAIHRAGYQTFEGGVSEGDRGILIMFKKEQFITTSGKPIQLKVETFSDGNIDKIKQWIDKGIPVMVRITTDSAKRDHHTQVAIGYSKKGFFLNDNDVFDNETDHTYIFNSFHEFESGFTGKYLVTYPINLRKTKKK